MTASRAASIKAQLFVLHLQQRGRRGDPFFLQRSWDASQLNGIPMYKYNIYNIYIYIHTEYIYIWNIYMEYIYIEYIYI